MSSYRQLIKHTFATIQSLTFRKFIVKFYRQNTHLQLPADIIKTWIFLLHQITKQQAQQSQTQSKVRDSFITPFCSLRFKGFVFDKGIGQDRMNRGLYEELFALYMKLQFDYLMVSSKEIRNVISPLTLMDKNGEQYFKKHAQEKRWHMVRDVQVNLIPIKVIEKGQKK